MRLRPRSGEKIKIAAIGDVIKNVFSEIEKKSEFSKESIESLWKEVVGEQAFKHSRPATLKKEVLTVFVDSSAWMQELSMKKRQILKGLKRNVGKDRISEIHFKIGEF